MDRENSTHITNTIALYDSVKNLLSIVPQYVYGARTLSAKSAYKLTEITQLISDIYTLLLQFSSDSYFKELLDEFSQIVEAICIAQENDDIVFCADILEGDFLPFMQRLFIHLSEVNSHNSADEVYKNSDNRITFCSSINGLKNAIICGQNKQQYLHSSIDPMNSAKILARSLVNVSTHHFCVLGMGLGYEILALLDENPFVTVKAWEFNKTLYEAALSNIDLSKYYGRIECIYEPDIRIIWNSICKEVPKDYTHILRPELLMIDDCEMFTMLNEYLIQTSNHRDQEDLMNFNFTKIQSHKIPECEVLKPIIDGRDTLVVGGGPSLNQLISQIKSQRENYAIIAVGRSVGALALHDIIPDIIVISDPKEEVGHQLDSAKTKPPLVLLSTAQSSYVGSYSGEKYVAYQEGYASSESYAKEHNYYTYKVGGSVSSFALDMALHFNANSITLVGLDLAYVDNLAHANGAGDETTLVTSQDPTVISNEGQKIYTSDVFMMYKSVIEARILSASCNSSENHIKIYNTGRGAKIAGTTWIPAI